MNVRVNVSVYFVGIFNGTRYNLTSTNEILRKELVCKSKISTEALGRYTTVFLVGC